MAHIRDCLLAARDDIVGIILFGSFARSEVWHDIDVLVVLRERIPSRTAWAAIMRQCQDAIGLYNLDLIPTHLDGLRQGLAEHVFILMDVAFDGLVIYGGETIERLLREAREEITARGIRRTDTGGWRFPVKHRQSTPLSPGTNSERAQRWLEDAGREIEIAEQLDQSGHFDRCVYRCQQSIERAVKAVLICFGAAARQALKIARDFVAWWFAPDEGN
ncbi:MAG TPA: HEPN domain-containing protein [Anaerolineae bacterium]|nr:HEPN domain-containing protein [Anaerolineae bacterium]